MSKEGDLLYSFPELMTSASDQDELPQAEYAASPPAISPSAPRCRGISRNPSLGPRHIARATYNAVAAKLLVEEGIQTGQITTKAQAEAAMEEAIKGSVEQGRKRQESALAGESDSEI